MAAGAPRTRTRRALLATAVVLTTAVVLATGACWSGSDDQPPPEPTSSPTAVVIPSLPRDDAIVETVDGVLDTRKHECAPSPRPTPPPALPGYVSCLVSGPFHDLPGHDGRVFMAFMYPPGDLTLDGSEPETAEYVIHPAIGLGEQLEWCLDWTVLAVPEATQAIGCLLEIGRFQVHARVALTNQDVRVLVNVYAKYTPYSIGCDVLIEPYQCGEVDTGHIERLALDLARRLLAEA